mmetsp:Transcript_53083/g.80502  ORF Transcript_53083/g.80502 Transcript_53083/m.80502 type:complete len:202 (-) Transcript_53083:148-753(-)
MNSPNMSSTSVCMLRSKSPNSSNSSPKRQVPMRAKDDIISTISSAECQKSSIALATVPVSSASLGWREVHWMTRRSEMMRMTFRKESKSPCSLMRPSRSSIVRKKTSFFSRIGIVGDPHGMPVSSPRMRSVSRAVAVTTESRRATNNVTARTVVASVKCLKSSCFMLISGSLRRLYKVRSSHTTSSSIRPIDTRTMHWTMT